MNELTLWSIRDIFFFYLKTLTCSEIDNMKNLFFLFLLIPFIFQACGVCTRKTVTCPSYDSTYRKQWFPYTKGQKLIFKNATTNTLDTFAVTDCKVIDEDESTSYGGYSSKGGLCASEFYIRFLSQQDTTPLAYYVRHSNYTYMPSKSSSEFGEIRFNFGTFSYKMTEKDSLSATNGSYLSSFTLENGITYTGLQSLVTTSKNNTGTYIGKLYIAKGQGLVGFIEYPSLQQWAIQ